MTVNTVTNPVNSVKPVKNVVQKVSPINNNSERSTVSAVAASKEEERITRQIRLTREDSEYLAEIMNKMARMFNSQLNFEVYEETNQLYVQFIDRETREVIKQIPPEELLELSAKIQEMVGLILDKYA